MVKVKNKRYNQYITTKPEVAQEINRIMQIGP